MNPTHPYPTPPYCSPLNHPHGCQAADAEKEGGSSKPSTANAKKVKKKKEEADTVQGEHGGVVMAIWFSGRVRETPFYFRNCCQPCQVGVSRVNHAAAIASTVDAMALCCDTHNTACSLWPWVRCYMCTQARTRVVLPQRLKQTIRPARRSSKLLQQSQQPTEQQRPHQPREHQMHQQPMQQHQSIRGSSARSRAEQQQKELQQSNPNSSTSCQQNTNRASSQQSQQHKELQQSQQLDQRHLGNPSSPENCSNSSSSLLSRGRGRRRLSSSNIPASSSCLLVLRQHHQQQQQLDQQHKHQQLPQL